MREEKENIKKKSITQYTLQELIKRIDEICSTLKNDTLKSRIKQAAMDAFTNGDTQALRSLLILCLIAQNSEELITDKVEKEGLEYDFVLKEYLSEIEPAKAIKDITQAMGEVSSQLKNKSGFKPKND
ncbi:hypothetical protein HWN49_27060 [Pseudomonas aeruginosa]|uniref:hypothetical protein n=1 Tax=Pseudomonas aeruginosa TaxID=287 RepID=UPI00159CCF06|nr:hypothetical protein [Pseudomonas aeruginosa]QKZ78923.1 hypothetical protein HWN49_27060 [Pseudomonas aeruginosa]HBP1919028.1 hypothetical protein [Pseudomonas aeruginosa]HBP1975685.1 hypothetical protein [Pseudomonas aeruginosa]HBP1987751.1 hypothetical protein [Pseudomonas aeruginosa]HBP1998761.1 hypothetical protein [Pseudomonas aeruginosa]